MFVLPAFWNTCFMAQPPSLYLFLLIILLGPLGIDVYLPAIPAIAESMNTHVDGVQASVAMYLSAMGLGQLIAGPLADRYGRKPLGLSGIALYFSGALIASLATMVEVLWFSRVLQGLGACAISVCVISGVRDSYSLEKASRIYSYLNGVICVIPALAPMLGGLLLNWWGWESGFILMYAYAILMAFVIILKLPETLPAKTEKQKKLISLERYKPILINPKFRFHAGMVMLFMGIIIAYISMVSVQLMVVMKQTTFAFSLWFGFNAFINIIASFTAPKIIDRVGRKFAIQFASSLALFAGVWLLLVLDSLDPLALMIPVFISSTGVSFVFAVSNAGALAPFGERAGTASALLGFFQMTGASLMVALVNTLPFGAMANFAIVMFLPMIWLGLHSFNKQDLFKLDPAN